MFKRYQIFSTVSVLILIGTLETAGSSSGDSKIVGVIYKDESGNVIGTGQGSVTFVRTSGSTASKKVVGLDGSEQEIPVTPDMTVRDLINTCASRFPIPEGVSIKLLAGPTILPPYQLVSEFDGPLTIIRYKERKINVEGSYYYRVKDKLRDEINNTLRSLPTEILRRLSYPVRDLDKVCQIGKCFEDDPDPLVGNVFTDEYWDFERCGTVRSFFLYYNGIVKTYPEPTREEGCPREISSCFLRPNILLDCRYSRKYEKEEIYSFAIELARIQGDEIVLNSPYLGPITSHDGELCCDCVGDDTRSWLPSNNLETVQLLPGTWLFFFNIDDTGLYRRFGIYVGEGRYLELGAIKLTEAEMNRYKPRRAPGRAIRLASGSEKSLTIAAGIFQRLYPHHPQAPMTPELRNFLMEEGVCDSGLPVPAFIPDFEAGWIPNTTDLSQALKYLENYAPTRLTASEGKDPTKRDSLLHATWVFVLESAKNL